MKGIDPKAREIAKDLARRSGMTLGEWLNSVIYDDNADTPEGAPSLRAASAAADRPASENRAPRRSGDDLDRVLAALEDLSTRFDAAAQEQAETAARFEQAIADLKADQSKVAQRLQGVEHGGGGKAETLRALEGALNKVAGHLANGESRHRDAMVDMRRELGDEMVRIADQVNRKVLEVENRSADAMAQINAEVSRVASTVEQRLRRADESQAEALEKLGGEIARITERLSDRIAAAERRASQAVENVGEQVARVTDRIHARQERNESDLIDRMRQSEERTAKLIEDARHTIDRRLLRAGVTTEDGPPVSSAFAERWTAVEADAPKTVAAEPVQAEAFAAEHLEEEGVDAESILEALDRLAAQAAAEPDYDDRDEDDAPGGPYPVGLIAHAPTLAADVHSVAPEDLEALEAVAQAIAAEAAENEDEDEAEDEDHPSAFDLPPSLRAERADDESLRPSQRDLMAETRAAFGRRIDGVETGSEDEGVGIAFAGPRVRKSRQSYSMRGVLLAGGAAASIGLAATGYVALHPDIMHGLTPAPTKQIPVGPPSTPPTAAASAAPAQAAVALTAASPAPKSDAVDLESLYRDALAKVDAGDPSGVAPLRTAANLSYAPAQRRLGKLYEDGGAGVDQDLAEGRRWNQRAAANGDARGMHNLGLDYYQGLGGIKNVTVAAEWFRRAAQLGLRDSQYNLARFYEEGVGVPRDLPTAYRWYLIAGRAGDTEAAARGATIKGQLTPGDAARTEAMANAFRPDPSAPPASLTAGLQGSNAKQLSLAARALAKLGYYKGADDGQPSQALGEAIQAYQRDRGLADNGQLSPELVQTFAHISQ